MIERIICESKAPFGVLPHLTPGQLNKYAKLRGLNLNEDESNFTV